MLCALLGLTLEFTVMIFSLIITHTYLSKKKSQMQPSTFKLFSSLQRMLLIDLVYSMSSVLGICCAYLFGLITESVNGEPLLQIAMSVEC